MDLLQLQLLLYFIRVEELELEQAILSTEKSRSGDHKQQKRTSA